MKNRNTEHRNTGRLGRVKRSITACMILLLLISAFGSTPAEAAPFVFSAAGKFERQMENNRYAEALEIYREKMLGDAALEVRAANILEEYLNTKWAEYIAESIGKADFEAALQTVRRINDETFLLGWFPDEIQEEYSVIAASREAYQDAQLHMERGEYIQAMRAYSQVAPEDSRYFGCAQEQYTKAEAGYVEEILSLASEAEQSGDYDRALEIIELAESTVGYQERFEAFTTAVTTKRFEAKMRELSGSGDFSAMKVLYEQVIQDPDYDISAEMTALFADLKNRWRSAVIERAADAYRTGGYENALPIISEALLTLPGDAQLLEYEQMYRSCTPMSLVNLAKPPVDAEYNGNNNGISISHNSTKDTFGNEYSEYFRFWVHKDSKFNPYIVMNLDGKYETLNAVCFVTSRSAENNIGIRIYADGVLCYESGLMTKMDDAKEIALNVSGVRLLQVESYTTHSSYGGTYFWLADTWLQHTL